MQKFFLTGPNRTGTTLLARCISDHPDCICLFESNIHVDAFGGLRTVGHSGRMKNHGFSPEQTSELRKRVKKGDVVSLLRWYDECAAILRDLYQKPNLTHIGDKNPYFHTSPGMIDAIAPYHKIWTIRDPRSVWYSGKAKGKNYISSYLNNVKQLSSRMDDSTLIVRFEDLVLDPEATMKTVHEFLEVPHDSSFLDHKPDKYDRRFQWNPNSVQTFDPNQLEKWKTTTIPKTIMKQVKKIMRRFGYE